MSIWRVKEVALQPEIGLRQWSIRETDQRNRHFVGFNVNDCEGRVSSAVKTFDPVSRRGVTASGRVYELLGDPGFNADAEYVWQQWQVINGVGSSKDVTKGLLATPSSEEP